MVSTIQSPTLQHYVEQYAKLRLEANSRIGSRDPQSVGISDKAQVVFGRILGMLPYHLTLVQSAGGLQFALTHADMNVDEGEHDTELSYVVPLRGDLDSGKTTLTIEQQIADFARRFDNKLAELKPPIALLERLQHLREYLFNAQLCGVKMNGVICGDKRRIGALLVARVALFKPAQHRFIHDF